MIRTQAEIEILCRDIYRQTQDAQEFIDARLRHNLGFEILMGPPFLKPHIAFIGYQPGDWHLSPIQAREHGYESGWVTDKCHYAVQNWRLARELQTVFPMSVLETCVGLNAIFLRAKDLATYNELIPARQRARIKDFCLERVQQILDAIEPDNILVIGFETMNLFGGRSEVHLVGREGRPLVKKGRVFGRPALAMLHLSGARISREDRDRIKDCISAIHRQAELET